MNKNNHFISEGLLNKFCVFISNKMGLRFSRKDWEDIRKKLIFISADLGFSESIESCIENLMNSPLTNKQINVLTRHLTVGETYFFRDPQSFEILKKVILPEFIYQRAGKDQFLRIWCAACSTGEEPYSIAILIHRLVSKNWKVSILGTDINSQFLHQAEVGRYKEWSFRSTPSQIKAQYFTKEPHSYLINSEIKQMVKFNYLNLVEDLYPSLLNGTNGMDIILCNNVLIYFTPEQIKNVIQKLTNSLVEGGYLFVSPIEIPYIQDPRLIPYKHEQFLYFKKQNKNLEKNSTDYCVTNHSHQLKPSSIPKKISQINPVCLICHTEKSESDEKVYEEALACYEKGLYEKAAGKLENWIKQGSPLPNEPHEKILLIKTYANQGRIDLALQWCEHTLQMHKLNPQLYYLQAQMLQELNQIAQAIQSIKKALYLDSNFVMAHFSLGNLLLIQGNSKEANRHFRNVLDLLSKYNPNDLLEKEDHLSAQRLADLTREMMR